MQDDFRTIFARASRHMLVDAVGVGVLAGPPVVSLHPPGLI